jgi:hypothetical protein
MTIDAWKGRKPILRGQGLSRFGGSGILLETGLRVSLGCLLAGGERFDQAVFDGRSHVRRRNKVSLLQSVKLAVLIGSPRGESPFIEKIKAYLYI